MLDLDINYSLEFHCSATFRVSGKGYAYFEKDLRPIELP